VDNAVITEIFTDIKDLIKTTGSIDKNVAVNTTNLEQIKNDLKKHITDHEKHECLERETKKGKKEQRLTRIGILTASLIGIAGVVISIIALL